MLAYNPVSSLEENLSAMEELFPSVISIEITRAVRDTTVDGVPVSLGDYIALVDDRLALTAESAEEALAQAVAMAGAEPGSILTVYRGADADPGALDACIAALEERTPGLEVEQVYGGQPHYHYLASVE